jgi:hypothetical protein
MDIAIDHAESFGTLFLGEDFWRELAQFGRIVGSR